MQVTWQYKRTGPLDEEELNRLGQEGWELVAVAADGGCYFKRPAPDLRERITLEQKARAYASLGVGHGGVPGGTGTVTSASGATAAPKGAPASAPGTPGAPGGLAGEGRG